MFYMYSICFKCINLSEQYMRRFQFKIACSFMMNLSKWSLLGKIPVDTTVKDIFIVIHNFI